MEVHCVKYSVSQTASSGISYYSTSCNTMFGMDRICPWRGISKYQKLSVIGIRRHIIDNLAIANPMPWPTNCRYRKLWWQQVKFSNSKLWLLFAFLHGVNCENNSTSSVGTFLQIISGHLKFRHPIHTCKWIARQKFKVNISNVTVIAFAADVLAPFLFKDICRPQGTIMIAQFGHVYTVQAFEGLARN